MIERRTAFAFDIRGDALVTDWIPDAQGRTVAWRQSAEEMSILCPKGGLE